MEIHKMEKLTKRLNAIEIRKGYCIMYTFKDLVEITAKVTGRRWLSLGPGTDL